MSTAFFFAILLAWLVLDIGLFVRVEGAHD